MRPLGHACWSRAWRLSWQSQGLVALVSWSLCDLGCHQLLQLAPAEQAPTGMAPAQQEHAQPQPGWLSKHPACAQRWPGAQGTLGTTWTASTGATRSWAPSAAWPPGMTAWWLSPTARAAWRSTHPLGSSSPARRARECLCWHPARAWEVVAKPVCGLPAVSPFPKSMLGWAELGQSVLAAASLAAWYGAWVAIEQVCTRCAQSKQRHIPACIALARDACSSGTAHARSTDTGRLQELGPARAVCAMVLAGERMWVGDVSGRVRLWGGERYLVRPCHVLLFPRTHTRRVRLSRQLQSQLLRAWRCSAAEAACLQHAAGQAQGHPPVRLHHRRPSGTARPSCSARVAEARRGALRRSGRRTACACWPSCRQARASTPWPWTAPSRAGWAAPLTTRSSGAPWPEPRPTPAVDTGRLCPRRGVRVKGLGFRVPSARGWLRRRGVDVRLPNFTPPARRWRGSA